MQGGRHSGELVCRQTQDIVNTKANVICEGTVVPRDMNEVAVQSFQQIRAHVTVVNDEKLPPPLRTEERDQNKD